MSDSYNTVDKGSTYVDPEHPVLVSGQVLLGRYRLETEAGKGNMGVVWKAWDEVGDRWVALKFVLRENGASSDSTEQLKKAFDTIQSLNHQNIGQIYSIEKDPEFGYFVVMKWLEGKPLSKTEIPQEQIPVVLAQVADALDYAHKKGVIHRDVKPSNIFIENDYEACLIDFGIAAGIQNSVMQDVPLDVCLTSGTRQYMAPEQWRGQPQDGRTDQYALAAVAYQLYSGRLPFQNPDVGLLRMAILQDAPEPIKNVPACVNNAILRALSKEREDRFDTCREFMEALMGDMPVTNKKSRWTIPSLNMDEEKKRQLGFAILSVLLMVILFGLALSSLKTDQSPEEPQTPTVQRPEEQPKQNRKIRKTPKVEVRETVPLAPVEVRPEPQVAPEKPFTQAQEELTSIPEEGQDQTQKQTQKH